MKNINMHTANAAKRKAGVESTLAPVMELSTDNCTPGMLRIFGNSVRPGANYKSVLASSQSTAAELVKEALCRYNIPETRADDYVLCEVIGEIPGHDAFTPGNTAEAHISPPSGSGIHKMGWDKEYLRVMDGNDRPLLLRDLWKPVDGYSRRFEIRKRDEITSMALKDKVTPGLNFNARKIQMSKVKPGVIPGGVDTEPLHTQSTLTKKEKNNSPKNSSRIDLTSCNSDASAYKVYYPDCHSELPQSPTHCPFLLTIRGYDIKRDKLYYTIEYETSIIGGLCVDGGSPTILLNSPDMLEKHCLLKRRTVKSNSSAADIGTHHIVEIEPEPGAKITVNNWAVFSRIVLASGDLVAVGDHYVFLYKDLSCGHDIPLELPWLAECNRNTTPEESPQLFCTPEGDKMFEFSDQSLHDTTEESVFSSLSDKREDSDGVSREKVPLHQTKSIDSTYIIGKPFSYIKDSEEDLVKYISWMVDPLEDNYRHSAAYLYCLCVDYSMSVYGFSHTKKLLTRILTDLRETILRCSTTLAEETESASSVDIKRPGSVAGDQSRMSAVVYWSANVLELSLYVREHVFTNRPDIPDMDAERHKYMSQFEEIVKFGFQQTVYSTTKTLYSTISAILDANPFTEGKVNELDATLRILQETHMMGASLQLHVHIIRQIFVYLLFFINTNTFNKLLSKGAGPQYYHWHAAVRIAGNIELLEAWAAEYGLQSEFATMFSTSKAAVELLAIPKTKLMQMSWSTLRDENGILTPGQLHQLLCEYQVGPNNEMPSAWIPEEEDMKAVLSTGSVQLKLSSHPPFTLPDGGCSIDLGRELSNCSLQTFYNEITSKFSTKEDDEDSGCFLPNRRRPTGSLNSHTQLTETFGFFKTPNSQSPSTESKPSPSPLPSSHVMETKNLSSDSEIPDSSPESAKVRTDDGSPCANAEPNAVHISVVTNQENEKLDSISSDHSNNNAPHIIPLGDNKSDDLKLKESVEIIIGTHKPVAKQPPGVKKKPTHHIIQHPVNQSNEVTEADEADVPVVEIMVDNGKTSEDLYCIDVQSTDMDYNGNNGLKVRCLEESSANKPISTLSCLDSLSIVSNGHEKDKLACENNNNNNNNINNCNNNKKINQEDKLGHVKDVEYVEITKTGDGIGLGLIDGLHTPLNKPGLYVRSIVSGSPADIASRIDTGDQILSVNGASLIDADYSRAMQLIRDAGSNIELAIIKHGKKVASKILKSLAGTVLTKGPETASGDKSDTSGDGSVIKDIVKDNVINGNALETVPHVTSIVPGKINAIRPLDTSDSEMACFDL